MHCGDQALDGALGYAQVKHMEEAREDISGLPSFRTISCKGRGRWNRRCQSSTFMPRLAKSVAAKTLVWDHLTLNPSSSAAYGEGDRETEREREGGREGAHLFSKFQWCLPPHFFRFVSLTWGLR